VLDESTPGLAPVILEQLSKALETLRQTMDITALPGEQKVTFALPHADRVDVIERARGAREGDPHASPRQLGRAICNAATRRFMPQACAGRMV
jgi:ABC-type branched-subunit amino acid transport system ATPase component